MQRPHFPNSLPTLFYVTVLAMLVPLYFFSATVFIANLSIFQSRLLDLVDECRRLDLGVVDPEAEAFQCQHRSLSTQNHLSSSSLPSFFPQIFIEDLLYARFCAQCRTAQCLDLGAQAPALSLISCVTFGKLYNGSETQFPHL